MTPQKYVCIEGGGNSQSGTSAAKGAPNSCGATTALGRGAMRPTHDSHMG